MIYYARISHVKHRLRIKTRRLTGTHDHGEGLKVVKTHEYTELFSTNRDEIAKYMQENYPDSGFEPTRLSGKKKTLSATRLLSEGQQALKSIVDTLRANGELPTVAHKQVYLGG